MILGTDYPFPLGEVQIVDTWPGKVDWIQTNKSNKNIQSKKEQELPHNYVLGYCRV